MDRFPISAFNALDVRLGLWSKKSNATELSSGERALRGADNQQLPLLFFFYS